MMVSVSDGNATYGSRSISLVPKIFIICSLAILSGCFDVDQKLIIDKSGNADLSIYMSMNSTLASTIALEKGINTTSICESDAILEIANQDQLSVQVASYYEGNELVCDWQIQAAIEALSSIEPRGGNEPLIRVEDLGDRKARVTFTIDFSDANKDLQTADPDTLSLTQGLLGTFMSNRNLSWSISAEEIISSNGRISDDRRTTKMTVPMSVALTERGIYTFESVIVFKAPWYRRWI